MNNFCFQKVTTRVVTHAEHEKTVKLSFYTFYIIRSNSSYTNANTIFK